MVNEQNIPLPETIKQSIALTHTKHLPKNNQIIRYKGKNSDQWKLCKILSRAGKASGDYKFFLNIECEENNETKCVDWKNDVSDWEVVEETVF